MKKLDQPLKVLLLEPPTLSFRVMVPNGVSPTKFTVSPKFSKSKSLGKIGYCTEKFQIKLHLF